ncbi:MAG: hypothetical protein NZ889_00755 [Candidatus Pacearchaeota archaeon]|nr:hypothetical protein [Candidatus Pacearchaeota archaeon]
MDEILKEIKRVTQPSRLEPIWKSKLIYDSTAEQLEPVYFWILDFMQESGLEVEKLVDNFSASVGGGYFAELGARATKMQEEAMKILGTVNTVLKSIINLLYDLKEFEIRLQIYKDLKEEKKKDAALLALKQIWMDKVDIQRGRGSINALTYDLNFVTLRDAFMAAKSPEDVDKMDLNERVKRILKPRLLEFFDWVKRSEKELNMRFELEKQYLKSQVNSLKLYTSWAKPYLRAAEQLRMKETSLKEPSLVNAFNTILLELTLLGKKKIKIVDEIALGNLPKSMKNYKQKRDYYACVLLDFNFRGIPTRTAHGHFIFGGRAEVDFKAFTLNSEELSFFQKKLEEQELYEMFKFVEGATEESLKQIQKDIEHFLGKEEKEKKKDISLFGVVEEKKEKKEEKIELKKIKKDSYEESLIRNIAEIRAAEICFDIYDKYKKAHGMASFPGPEFQLEEWRRTFSPEWR